MSHNDANATRVFICPRALPAREVDEETDPASGGAEKIRFLRLSSRAPPTPAYHSYLLGQSGYLVWLTNELTAHALSRGTHP